MSKVTAMKTSKVSIESLKKAFLKCGQLSYDAGNNNAKNEELEDMSRKKWHDSMKRKCEGMVLRTCDEETLMNLRVELEEVKTEKQHQMWVLLRTYTSSIKTHKNPGKNLRILLKDATTDKYIGIMSLGSDLYAYQARDDYIGWSRDAKRQMDIHVANIFCCVSMQPLGFNFNLGKLLASLCFSKELLGIWETKYNQKLACISTFSINGKSIQYDRLNCLKLVGYTKGFGANHIPNALYLQALEFLRGQGVDIAAECPRVGKVDRLRVIFKALELPMTILHHGQQRGVYVGFTGKNSKEFLCQQTKEFSYDDAIVRPVDAIVEWWRQRWALQRYRHLVATNTLKIHTITNESDSLRWMDEMFRDIPVSRAEFSLSPEYIAGFIDGDGTIAMGKTRYSVELYVSIGQCDPRPLLLIQKMFGGYLRVDLNEENNKRPLFRIKLKDTECQQILTYVRNTLILKEKRCNLALEYIDFMSKDQTNNSSFEKSRLEYYDKMVSLQSDFIPVNDFHYREKMNLTYIAGFFDAEGCLMAKVKSEKYMDVSMTITQTSNIEILHTIRTFLGFGTVNESGRWVVYSKKDIGKFLEPIMDYIIVKRDQCQMFFESDIDIQTKSSQIKELKHKSWELTDEQITNANLYLNKKNTDDSKNAWTANKKHHFSIRQKKAVSERVVDVEKQMDHRIALSLSNIKNALVSDDIINQVRLLSETLRQCDIIKKTNIGRSTVHNILIGKIRKADEIDETFIREKLEKKQCIRDKFDGMTEEEKYNMIHKNTGISKRKFQTCNAIRLIRYQLEHRTNAWKSLSEKTLVLFGCAMTVITLKGITSGRTKMYEDQFPCENMTYAEYTAAMAELNGTE